MYVGTQLFDGFFNFDVVYNFFVIQLYSLFNAEKLRIQGISSVQNQFWWAPGVYIWVGLHL